MLAFALCLAFLFSPLMITVLAHPVSFKGFHKASPHTSFTYKIISGANNTWGYNILRDNKIFIHQPNKPGLPGVEGFKTKEDAVKTAELVISKIKKGEIPPTVSRQELISLNLSEAVY